jgi:penicillin-binding protein 1A
VGSRNVRRLLQALLALGVLLIVLAAGGAATFYALIVRDLPRVQSLRDYTPNLGTRVLARDGRRIGELFREHRIVVPIEAMPEHLVHAFIAAEDDAFYRHEGLDYPGILRAAIANLRAGEVRQGGSTITQQVAKTLLLSSDRTYVRKLKDMVLARRIERSLDKNEILYLYLNQIYLGAGAYGVEAAAQTYYGKSASELTLGEGALIAGLVPAPSLWNPFRSAAEAKRRQRLVLRRMREQGYIDADRYQAALAEELRFAQRRASPLEKAAASYVEEVRRYLVERYGIDRVLTGGLEAKAALDPDAQIAAYDAVRAGLRGHDRRRGYRGPVHEVKRADFASARAGLSDPNAPSEEPGALLLGLVTDVDDALGIVRVALDPERETTLRFDDLRWARKEDPELDGEASHISRASQALRTGWVVQLERLDDAEDGSARYALYQEPKAEGALFALDLESGRVDAMVGGYDFARSEFNRALQMKRQPGSAFKPMIYAAALSSGYTPASIVHDTPIVYQDESTGLVWKPENYSERFYGPITLREALAHSRNIATIKLLQEVGVHRVIETAHAVGIHSRLDPNLSLALGTSEVTLAELVRAYAAFGAGGRRVEPIFLLEVRDRDGTLLEHNVPLALRADEGTGEGASEIARDLAPPEPGAAPPGYALDPVTAYLITDMMKAVVEEGTARRVRVLGRPIAGKTGTTNDLYDAWFVGFSPQKAAGAWLGYDALQALGRNETGGRTASPIFIDYMRAALAPLPMVDFERPPSVVFARIDRRTGLLARANDEDAVFQPFREGTVPEQQSSDPLPGGGELVSAPTRLD